MQKTEWRFLIPKSEIKNPQSSQMGLRHFDFGMPISECGMKERAVCGRVFLNSEIRNLKSEIKLRHLDFGMPISECGMKSKIRDAVFNLFNSEIRNLKSAIEMA